MKLRDFVKILKRNGWWLEREGSKHTIYTNGKASETVPKGRTINKRLADAIIKRQGLK